MNKISKEYISGITVDVTLQLIADKVLNHQRISVEDGLLLYNNGEPGFLGTLADFVRSEKNGNVTFFNRNFHVEPTNICVFACSFCSYSRTLKQKDEGWELNAKQILENLFGSWSTQIEVMKKSYTQCMATPLKEFQWVGWIAKEGDKWVLRLREPSPNSVLFVVTGQGKKARVVSLQVAKPVEGTIIQNTDLFGQLAGKPVYAMDELPASISGRD